MPALDALLLPNSDGIYDIFTEGGRSKSDETPITSIKNSVTENGKLPDYMLPSQNIFLRGGSVGDILNNNTGYLRGSRLWFVCRNAVIGNRIIGEAEDSIKKSLLPYIDKGLLTNLSVNATIQSRSLNIKVSFSFGKLTYNFTIINDYLNNYANIIPE